MANGNSDTDELEQGGLTSAEDMRAAHYMLQNTPLSITDAVRLIIELMEGVHEPIGADNESAMKRCRQVIHMGLKAYELSGQTVSFGEAVEALLAYKNAVRERTLKEIRQICNRLMSSMPEWRYRRMREIDTDYCQRSIVRTFGTVSMQRKARRILHSVFSYAQLNGWNTGNPLDLVVLPPYVEKPIRALSLKEISVLLETVSRPEFADCVAAVGLMLWAGIRPGEVMRLHYRDLNFEDRVITVPPNHSKTGGSRQVVMYPVLHNWLIRHLPVIMPDASITPNCWYSRWGKLRKKAGFQEWRPDILRHTFASYHLKHFKDINVLVLDMGHATPQLLRTRYLAMDNLTAEAAKAFWEYGLP